MTTGSIDYTTLRVRDLLNGATSSGDLPSTTEWLKAYGEYLTPYGLASLLELHTAIQREGTANRLIEMLPVSDRPSVIDEIAGNDDAERLASVVEAIAKYDLNSPLVPFVGGELWEGATEPQLRATARLCGRVKLLTGVETAADIREKAVGPLLHLQDIATATSLHALGGVTRLRGMAQVNWGWKAAKGGVSVGLAPPQKELGAKEKPAKETADTNGVNAEEFEEGFWDEDSEEEDDSLLERLAALRTEANAKKVDKLLEAATSGKVTKERFAQLVEQLEARGLAAQRAAVAAVQQADSARVAKGGKLDEFSALNQLQKALSGSGPSPSAQLAGGSGGSGGSEANDAKDLALIDARTDAALSMRTAGCQREVALRSKRMELEEKKETKLKSIRAAMPTEFLSEAEMKVEDLFGADLNMLELSMDIVECETSGRTGMVLGLEERIKRQMNLKFQAQEYLQRLLKASTIFKSSPTQARYYMKLYKEELSGFGTKDSQHERFEKESRKRTLEEKSLEVQEAQLQQAQALAMGGGFAGMLREMKEAMTSAVGGRGGHGKQGGYQGGYQQEEEEPFRKKARFAPPKVEWVNASTWGPTLQGKAPKPGTFTKNPLAAMDNAQTGGILHKNFDANVSCMLCGKEGHIMSECGLPGSGTNLIFTRDGVQHHTWRSLFNKGLCKGDGSKK